MGVLQDGHWFCLQCNDVADPKDLTYEERCSFCGSTVQWVFENPIYGSAVYLSMKKRAEQAETERDELRELNHSSALDRIELKARIIELEDQLRKALAHGDCNYGYDKESKR